MSAMDDLRKAFMRQQAQSKNYREKMMGEQTSEALVEMYEVAIRKLRDAWVRGDDKCWKDLVELFQVLPEGFTPPARDTLVELGNCEKYIKSCHHPEVEYVSPQRRIEELEVEVAALRASIMRPKPDPFTA